MTPWHLSSLYVFLLRQSAASFSCGPWILGGSGCPHLELHTRMEVSYAVCQESRRGSTGKTDCSGVAWRLCLQILFQTLWTIPLLDHMIADQDGEFDVLPHHGHFLIFRSDERVW